jgi:aspartate ammonia-lyase
VSVNRIEHDPLGSVEVPAGALYGAATARALTNFPGAVVAVGDRPELVRALAHVKAAAALTNVELGVLDPEIGRAIVAAADELVAGLWHDQLPLALVQGGGGTATNMAVNEVIANRAGELLGAMPGSYAAVHPLDHVNRSQSTNDVHPTAVAVAAIDLAGPARAGLASVVAALEDRAAAHRGLDRLGRTCLQDALPLAISDYHLAQAHAVARCAGRLASAVESLHAIPLGATAVGTGAGTPPGYRERVVALLASRTGLPLQPAADLFDALAHLDPMLELAAAALAAATTLAKIASDLRLLASGPVGGIGEVRLPAVQVGSSMMPAKVNPAIPEFVIQVSFEIRGAFHIIESAVAAGELDLNVMEPVICRYLLEALGGLAIAAQTFADRCLSGLEWDRDAVAAHLAGSLLAAVEHAATVGHDAARLLPADGNRG